MKRLQKDFFNTSLTDLYKQEILGAITYSDRLKFDKQHPWHRTLVALYCSLIEYSEALLYLALNNKSIAVPVVFRGLLEAYVDFKNLAEDKSYGNYLEASYAEEWRKVFKEAAQGENAFLSQISEDSALDTQLQEQERRLAELKEKGYTPLTQYQKFEKAGMREEYRSVYNFVCSHSHNNIRALMDRFLIIRESERDFDVVLFKEQTPADYEHYVMTGKEYLTNASRNIHALLGTGVEDQFPVR